MIKLFYHKNFYSGWCSELILLYDNLKDNTNDERFKVSEESHCNNIEYIIKKIKSVNYDNTISNLNKVRDIFTLKGVQEEVYKILKQ